MRHDEYAAIPPGTFEIEALGRDDEALSVVMKGHLYVEQYLALLLSNAGLKVAFELSFGKKIDHGLQFGVVRRDEGAMLKALNRIRNNFAHGPRAYLSEETVQELWDVLSDRIKNRIATIGRFGAQDFDLPLDCLKCCIVAVVAMLAEDLDGCDSASPL